MSLPKFLSFDSSKSNYVPNPFTRCTRSSISTLPIILESGTWNVGRFSLLYSSQNLLTLLLLAIYANLATHVKLWIDQKKLAKVDLSKDDLYEFWNRMTEHGMYQNVNKSCFIDIKSPRITYGCMDVQWVPSPKHHLVYQQLLRNI